MSDASAIKFESSERKAREREVVRAAREELLERDRAQGARRAQARQAELGWNLPGLETHWSEAASTQKKKKKALKKAKKAKKAEKKKAKKAKKKKSSRPDSSESEDEWVEAQAPVQPEPSPEVQRDGWMQPTTRPAAPDPFLALGVAVLRKPRQTQKQIEQKAKEEANQREWHRRELNPHLRQAQAEAEAQAEAQAEANAASDQKRSAVPERSRGQIGDGGAAWLLRALKRAREQAEREGKSLAEIATERWGSLEKFEALLAKARGQSPPAASRSPGPRRDEPRSRASTSQSWKTSQRREADTRGRVERARERSSSASSSTSSSGRSRSPKAPSSRSAGSKAAPADPPADPPAPSRVWTESEINALGAQMIKAEIMGDEALTARWQAQLTEARQSQSQSRPGAQSNEDNAIVLTHTDAKGFTRPIETQVVEARRQGGDRKRSSRVATHGSDGKRQRYFADDDRYSLQEMFQREKLNTAEDQNAMMSRLVGKSIERTDEDYDLDDVFMSRANKKESEEKLLVQQRDRAIAQERKKSRTLDSCKFCFDGQRLNKHLIVAIGRTAYLALPHHVSLTEGHCFIVPMSHVACSTLTDEDLWEEIQLFRKTLVRMLALDDLDCIFFEHADRLKSFPHMIVECVPIPRESGDMAPMFFQKAIQECEMEWSDNKKLIHLKDKSLKRSVPKGLPYFHVDFGLDSGFAHVIEDEELFPRNFAQEIIGGMLDLEPRLWRNPKKEPFEAQKIKVLAFGAKWSQVDFTKKRPKTRSRSSSSSSSD
eukprot:maker-scaffold101_size371023-snap-gene-0.17 protein:Tk03050 transcript:maker-scaffold101_size371023-snap-gene-0.17-mRNA-1 annotation:"cwf19-like protein 2"